MTPEVSYFIPGSLEDTDKYIEVADGHHATVKKKSSKNKHVQRQRKAFHRNITQRNFGTRLMRQIIFNRYVNAFRTYLSFSQRVL